MTYKLNTEKKRHFIMAFLLDQMFLRDFSVTLEGNDSFLESYFIEMLSLNYVKIQNNVYVVDVKGEVFANNFTDKYNEFLKFYDIFCAVDLEAGEFAFKRFFDFETDEEWSTYLNQDNWSDVRIAVCNFKKIDPIEIVFLSFLNEGRFDCDTNTNWQFDLLSDVTWDEILLVCNTAITLDDDVTKDIIEQGSVIVLDNIKEEIKRNAETDEILNYQEETEEVIEEVVEETVYVDEVAYYDPYLYDPYYVSPCWLFLW